MDLSFLLTLCGIFLIWFGIYKLAIYKNRSPVGWILLCTLLTPVCIFFLIFLKKLPEGYSNEDSFSSNKKSK